MFAIENTLLWSGSALWRRHAHIAGRARSARPLL